MRGTFCIAKSAQNSLRVTDDLGRLAYERRRAFLEDIRGREKEEVYKPGKGEERAIPGCREGGGDKEDERAEWSEGGGYREEAENG